MVSGRAGDGGGSTYGEPEGTADPIAGLPAIALAARVAAGEISAEEVVAAHLARHAEVDPELNALVLVDAEDALAQAREVDRRRRRGEPLGALAGVPVAVKDNIDVRGQTTACGSRAHHDVLALHDAVVTTRLRRAGAILLGRANMDELAMGASTQTSAFGPTRNPLDPRRSPGGSSGGSSAAVASDQVALSVGTDTGGSVREPASQCGVVGMAPSPGLVPLDGVVPFAPGFDRVGPMGRDVSDTADLLAVLADDPALAARGLARDGLDGLRIGLVTDLAGPPNQPGVLERLRAAVAGLAGLGAELLEVSLPDAPAALATYMTITSCAAVPALWPYVEIGAAGEEVVRRHDLGEWLLREGETLARAEEERRVLGHQVEAALERCDLLLSPTMPTTAPVLAPATADDLADPMSRPYTDCWTVVANLTGIPAISVPYGVSPDDGMPVGVMLAGPPGSDGLLLRAAAALESTAG